MPEALMRGAGPERGDTVNSPEPATGAPVTGARLRSANGVGSLGRDCIGEGRVWRGGAGDPRLRGETDGRAEWSGPAGPCGRQPARVTPVRAEQRSSRPS